MKYVDSENRLPAKLDENADSTVCTNCGNPGVNVIGSNDWECPICGEEGEFF